MGVQEQSLGGMVLQEWVSRCTALWEQRSGHMVQQQYNRGTGTESRVHSMEPGTTFHLQGQRLECRGLQPESGPRESLRWDQ